LGVRKRWGKGLTLLAAGFAVAVAIAVLSTPDDPSHPGTLLNRLGRTSKRTIGWVAQLFQPANRRPPGQNQPTATTRDSEQSAETDDGGFVVYGAVMDEQRRPVEGARVALRPAGETEFSEHALTDKNGAFRLTGLEGGSYDITVSHPDYVPLIRTGYTPPPTRQRERMDFILPYGTGINGIVRDEESAPVRGAVVSVRRRRLEQLAPGGNVFLDDSVYKTAQTDRDGTFTLRGIGFGENLFEVRAGGYDLLVQSVPIDAESAKQRIELTLRRSGKIAGLVLDERDAPVSSATIKLVTYKPLGTPAEKLPDAEKFTRVSNSDGAFSFEKLATEGFYDLKVEHPDFAPAFFSLVAPGTTRQVCKLSRGGTIRGSAVYIDRPTTPAAVNIMAQAVIKDTTVTRETKSDAAGAFILTRLPFGSWRLWSTSPDAASEPMAGVKCEKENPEVQVLLEVYEKCVAKGRVVDAESGGPVDGAEVRVECSYGPRQARRRQFMASSGPVGVFQFDSLPSGLVRISAKAQGYVASAASGSAQTFTLLPGERKTDLTLRLSRGGTVDGFVFDYLGRAVEGADTQLFVSATTPRSVNVSALKGKTDASGYFKLGGIDVGEHLQMYASAEKSGYARARSPMIDLTASKPYASTQIVLTRGASVEGHVYDERKLPIPEARVEFTSDEFPMDPSNKPQAVQTAADGSYRIVNCPPGRSHMSVSKSGYINGSASLKLSEGEARSGVDFQLKAGLMITGRLITLEGKPLAGARIRAVPHKYVPGRDETITDKGGYYTLKNLGDGLFDVRANFPIKTPDGDQSYEFFKLDVKAGTSNVEIECDINNMLVGTVEGEDKNPIDRFHLTLHSRRDTSPAQDFYFDLDRDYTSARGFFRVLNIPRGVYSMTLSAEGYEVYQNDNVVVGPSRRTVLPRIRLKAAGGVIGYVYSSETDRPVNDVTVRLTNPQKTEDEARRTALSTRTDYAGFFRLATAGAGTYVLELEHPNYISTTVDQVSVRQRGTTDLGRIYLEAGGSVQGVVLDNTGYGVNWAKVTVSGVYPEKSTHTNSFGNYLLLGVRPGRWPLVVDGNVNGRRVYVFHTIDIVAGETRQEDFQLETSANIVGSIVSAQGYVRTGNVHINPFDEYSNVLEDIRYDGSLSNQQFRINSVPSGQYFIWASGYGPVSSYTMWDTIYLQPGDNAVRLTLPSGYVSGVSMSASGGPAAGVEVQLMPIFDRFGVPVSVYNSLVRRARTNAAGQFAFGHVMAGAHQLLYYDPGIVGGGQWVALPSFWLSPDQTVSGITVTVGH
jgi:protocatechuate 3,4-dioxygenase beta subunit